MANPQTQDLGSIPGPEPLWPVNAKWVNGIAPGYWCTDGGGLNLNVGPGTSFGNGVLVSYAGATLALAGPTTNYVYLDPTAGMAPASNTSGYPVGSIPLATVVTSSTQIVSIVDDRTWFVAPTAGVDSQTGTSYTLGAADLGKLITLSNTSPVAVTLATSLGARFFCSMNNLNTGAATLTPSSGTINGRSSITLTQFQGIWIYCDGTNWYAVNGRVGGGVDPQTSTTYTLVEADYAKLVTITNSSAVAVTLPTTFGPRYFAYIENLGTGTAALTPSSGTINGAASLALTTGQGVTLFFDGTNWFALTGMGTGGGGGGLNGVNVQTGNYTALSGDNGKLIVFNSSSAVTLTMPASPPSSTWAIFVQNIGAGTLTINRNGLNIDAAAANLTLVTTDGTAIFTDGSNWFTERGYSLVMVGDSGSGGTQGLVPAPPAGSAALGQFLKADGTWADPGLNQYAVAVSSAVPGMPAAGQLVMIYTAYTSETFPANFASPNSYGTVGTNPTLTAVYDVYKNGTLVGSLSISTSGVFTLSTTGGTSFNLNAGDRLTAVAPGTQDATLSDVSFTLVGSRTGAVAVASLPLMTWQGTYSGATTYNPWDVVAFTVSSKVQSYVCIATTTGNDPTHTAFWSLLAQAGADGTVTTAQVQDESLIYALDTGAANAYAVSLTPTPSVVDGSVVVFRAANANTGASTLALNGGSANAITQGGSPLASGAIKANSVVMVVWDNTHSHWEIIGGAGGGDTTAKYIIGGADSTLVNALVWPGLYTNVDAPPASPTSMDDEFDAASLGGIWTWVNQGSATAMLKSSHLILSCPSNGGSQNARLIEQALPSAPYEFIAKITSEYPGGGNFEYLGHIVLRESATGKMITFGFDHNSSFPFTIAVTYWSSLTVDVTRLYSFGTVEIGRPVHFKVGRTGTTLYWTFSTSGVAYLANVYTEAITAHFTTAPDQVGLLINPASITVTAVIDFFRRTV